MSAELQYCDDLFRYQRRVSREVTVGNVKMGSDHPVVVQSMITSDTRDTEACVKQVLDLAKAGCQIVRITAQTKKYAANLENIRDGVRMAGCDVPLVADIHFKPDAAFEAAKWVEKIRVNPGNYADKKKFETREYTDDQYAEELGRIREEFAPLVTLCKDLGRAMRIGTNHGSLSDRIMNRYGDTPLGMVESALEFARIAREQDYHNFVFSMKASNPKVMIEAYRLLVARLAAEGDDWNYPLHLGVTEAGDGEDGRIKSAIGIGSLLSDGIGDTIRVSLTEDAVHEIPVARSLVDCVQEISGCGVPPQTVTGASSSPPEVKKRRASYLPHWEKDGAIYAVSYRLDGALPKPVLDDYRTKKEIIQKRIEIAKEDAGSSDCTKKLTKLHDELASCYQSHIESALHDSSEVNHLANPEIADEIINAWKHFDGERYQLYAWAIMPNHVHVLFRPTEGHRLEDILHSWKSFTSKKALGILGEEGTFWQKEYYDHLVRDEEDFENQLRYILNNPKGDLGEAWSAWGNDSEEATAGCRRDGLRRDAAATVVPSWNPFEYERRKTEVISKGDFPLGGTELVRVLTTREKYDAVSHKLDQMGDYQPEIVIEDANVLTIDPRNDDAIAAVNAESEAQLVTVSNEIDLAPIAAFRLLASRIDARHSILLKDTFTPVSDDFLPTLLRGSMTIGSLICDGIGDATIIQGESAPGQSLRLSYNILQASGARIFKTDYVACPSCGRTLFNLQDTTQKIREATGHLKGVRIAVMGCIVNGPGEMADADFGYVGGAPGKINLYVGKEAVKFNIPEAEAVERLQDLIAEHGKWVDPPAQKVEI